MERYEREYVRRLDGDIQSFIAPIEEAIAKIQSPSSWDKLVVKAFLYLRQIAELHRPFLGQLPTLPRSQYAGWARFLIKVVLEMQNIYGDYLALSPRAVRFFNLSYQQRVVRRLLTSNKCFPCQLISRGEFFSQMRLSVCFDHGTICRLTRKL